VVRALVETVSIPDGEVVERIIFWGLLVDVPSLIDLRDCFGQSESNQDTLQVAVRLWQPDQLFENPECSFIVSATPTPVFDQTYFAFGTPVQGLRIELELPTLCLAQIDRISIQGTAPPEACRLYWLSSPFGDGQATAIEGPSQSPESVVGDLAICVESSPCRGDANGDFEVSLADFGAVLSNFGNPGTRDLGDVTGDGVISLADFGAVLANFGLPCSPQ